MITARLARRLAVVLTAAGLVGAAGPPVAAAPIQADEVVPVSLTMVDGTGLLHIRDSESDFPLESPTTFTGSMTSLTGAVTQGALSTPSISFSVPVLNGAAVADVDATFTEVAPGTATGSVDPFGNVVIRTALEVDLHIDVSNGTVVGDCTTAPIQLEFLSTSAYDAATQTVAVKDPNFSIPAFPVTTSCPSVINGSLNDLLAGPGHSLAMSLTGAIDLPPEPGADSVTTLTVTPEGGADFGTEVTMDVAVAAADPDNTDAAGGSVTFFDGAKAIGTVALVDGIASLTTNALGVGSRNLVARYSGSTDFAPSVATLTYVVRAVPAISAKVPGTITLGAPAVDVPVTIETPSLSPEINNLATRLTIKPSTVRPFTPEQVSATYRIADGDPEPVTFGPGTEPRTASAILGPVTGRPSPGGTSFEDTLSLSFPGGGLAPGTFIASFELLEVAPSDGAVTRTIRSVETTFAIVPEKRAPVEVTLTDGFLPAVMPSIVRAGNSIDLPGVVVSPTGSATTAPTGTLSVAIDGQPVPAWAPTLPGGVATAPALEVPLIGNELVVDTPASLAVGSHTISVTYSGDSYFRPATVTDSFAVAAPIGRLYDCIKDMGIGGHRHRAQVRGLADLPRSAPAGTVVDLSRLDVDVFLDRSNPTANDLTTIGVDEPIGSPPAVSVEFNFGELGTGTAKTVTRTGETQWDPADTAVDVQLAFTGGAGQLTLQGAPGTRVPVQLDSFEFILKSHPSLPAVRLKCEPVGDAVSLGSVEIAGTTLEVDAPSPTRAGDEVVLTATVAPANADGSVAFYDGDTLIALALPREGIATANVTLPVGSHSLIARHHGGASAPTTTSDPHVLEVLPALQCAGFVDGRNGPVVRLAYMELLRRCPDQAGFAHWTGRLDSGQSAETFARSIAFTDEALDQVVIDAYRTTLERVPSPTDRAFWRERFKRRGFKYQLLLAELASSNEFYGLAGRTSAGFVTRVYDRMLGRAPDPAGLEHWTRRLANGGSRASVMRTISNLDEPLGTIVDRSYDEILDVVPGAAERLAAIEDLRRTGNRSALYARLIGDPRFVVRAAGLPNTND